MKKKKLKQYLGKEWKKAKKSLRTFITKGDHEALHRFRVQVKKLRAFITLAEETGTAEDFKRHFKPVRKIFSKAGTIRDAQLHIALGKQQHAGKDFLERQRQRMKKNAHRFRSRGRTYLERVSKSHRRIWHNIKPLPEKDIRDFYQEQLRWIAEHVNQGKEMLHPCRKRIKILLYDYKFVRKALKQQLSKDYLKALEKAIGDWHDNDLAAKLFPSLQKKEQILLDHVHTLSGDFYQKATAATDDTHKDI